MPEIYLNEIKDFQLLPREHERELLTNWRLYHNSSSRDILITSHLKLVVVIAKQYLNVSSLSLDDLIQEGNLGLIYAVDTFDIEKENKLSTYASWWIRHYITRALSNKSRLVRIPTSAIENKEKTSEILTLSINTPIGEDSEETLGEFIEDSNLIDPEADLFKEELRATLNSLLTTLTEREANIILERFGLNGRKPKTLDEVGKILGISKERVRQLENSALRKLRNPLRTSYLKDFI